MNKSTRILILVLSLAFTTHSVLTGIYAFQSAPFPAVVRELSNRYTIPMFHQNWKLFAPSVPEYDAQLHYRVKLDRGWTDWGDISRSNNFGHTSRVEYIEQSLTGALAWQIANNLYSRDQRMEFERIINSFDYGRALFFVKKIHLRNGAHIVPDSLQLRVQFTFTPPPAQAYSFQVSNVDFPPLIWNYERHD